MLIDVSQPTLNVLAGSKVILFAYTFLSIFFIYKKKQPWFFMLLTTVVFVSFYIVFSWPLKTMWWGNVGDEMFVLGFLGKVLLGNPWYDFYYGWLPQFYPPLYFWVTGILSKPFANNAIVAAKIGITGSMVLWFMGSYFWQKYFWNKVGKKSEDQSIESSAWFWWLMPVLYFVMLDFDTIMLKPYEAISALFGVILVGIIARAFEEKEWLYKHYLFVGVSGGLLFLIYYFWWIMLIPAILIMAIRSRYKLLNIKRTVLFGLIIFLISSIFIVPLFLSYFKYGLENGQAIYFIPQDFFTHVPWKNLSLQSIMYLFGLGGLLLFARKHFVKAALITLIVIFFYQFFNYIYFLLGSKPMQSSKGFYFLGTAACAVGLSYLVIHIYKKYISQWQPKYSIGIVLFGFILLVSRMPFVYFVDDPVALMQIERDLQPPIDTIQLAEAIKTNVPDHADRTWLSSGSMELGAYLPMSYYIAHNLHFSHHASNYSKRMLEVEKLSKATDAEEFITIIDEGQPRKIDSLLLYNRIETDENGLDYYPLWFWHDNFPNGGKDVEVRIPKNLISDKYWQEVCSLDNWIIFIRK